MSRNLKAISSVQRFLYRSGNKRCPYSNTSWGSHSKLSCQYSSQSNKNNKGFFKKYGFEILAAFGALFAAYQFKLIPGFGDENQQSDKKKKRSSMAPAALAPTVQLSNGHEIPALGLGTWQGEPGSKDVYKAVLAALDAGYRHFDTAEVYKTEEDIGKAVAEKIKAGEVKREELFLTTKVWNNHLEPEMVVAACQNSCKKLGMDYVDLYLIHWPFAIKGTDVNETAFEGEPSPVSLEETWRGMEKCVEKGLAKSIGLSNSNSGQIKRILDVAKVKPVNLQIEFHPYLNQRKLIDFCKKNNITVTAYSPLGAPWSNPDKPLLVNDPVLKEIGDKYKKSPAQVVLRYLIQSGAIPIPKSSSPKRIAENIAVFDFVLEQSDVDKIDALDKKSRACTMDPYKSYPEYPFKPEVEF